LYSCAARDLMVQFTLVDFSGPFPC